MASTADVRFCSLLLFTVTRSLKAGGFPLPNDAALVRSWCLLTTEGSREDSVMALDLRSLYFQGDGLWSSHRVDVRLGRLRIPSWMGPLSVRLRL